MCILPVSRATSSGGARARTARHSIPANGSPQRQRMHSQLPVRRHHHTRHSKHNYFIHFSTVYALLITDDISITNGRFALKERELRKREEALAAKEQDYKRRLSALKRLEKQVHNARCCRACVVSSRHTPLWLLRP